MAKIISEIIVPDDKKVEIIDDFCTYHSYPELINGKPNKETKAQFLNRKIAEFIKDSVKSLRANTQADIARTQQIAEVNLMDIR